MRKDKNDVELNRSLLDISEGNHRLKNGWILSVSKHRGVYEINKSGESGIWAERITGGQYGDGVWVIKTIPSMDVIEKDSYMSIYGDFDTNTCNEVADRMDSLLDKYSHTRGIRLKLSSVLQRLFRYIGKTAKEDK